MLDHASGHGSGTGGNVTLNSGNQLDLSLNQIITAGGDTGPGGKLTVTHAKVTYTSSDTIIQAWAGKSVTNTSTFGGSATINGVTCQQFQTGYTWPTFYRDCVNTTPTAAETLPASVASGLSGRLSSVKLSLYVMTDGSQFNSYFSSTDSNNGEGGFTPDPTGTNIDVWIFEKAVMIPNNTEQAFTIPGQLTEVVDHEFGHVIDLNAGVSNSSGSTTYSKAFTDDLNYLNAAGGGKPCLANGTGPFNGVVDFTTGAQFCNGATLNDPNKIYMGITKNADIAQASTDQLFEFAVPYGGALGYIEPFAQSFAYQASGYSLTYPSGYIDTTADGLMHKGFYSCIQATAANLAGKQYTPIFSYPCN